jgi:hypothetical protein
MRVVQKTREQLLRMYPNDPFATDTADPARIFREMFPSPAPRLDWRRFAVAEDMRGRAVWRRR